MYSMMYMGATRTQIYLTAEQRERIDEVRTETGQSLADVIRTALDDYLNTRRSNEYRTVLKESFGSMPDFSVPPRREWDRDV